MLLQEHQRNLELLPTVQVTLDQNKKIHQAGAMLKPRTILGSRWTDVLDSGTMRTQTVGPGTLPATAMRSTLVLREHSAVVEDLTEAVQGQPKVVMSFLAHLLPVSQLRQLLSHTVLEAWWLAALAVRVATQP